MKTYASLLLIPLIAAALALGLFSAGDAYSLQSAQGPLPDIQFLGEGPATFTREPGRLFLIKTYQNNSFLFITVDADTYQAAARERVWSIDEPPRENIRLFHESRSYGTVPAGCVVQFVQIEDNVDTRRNTFYINGRSLHVVEQGMVTYGSFTVPESGELTFYAEDSVGLVIQLCPGFITETVAPTVTDTVEIPTVTETMETPTSTATLTATATITNTPEVTLTLTASPTVTLTPQTPTATRPTGNNEEPTATPTISTVVRQTATPLNQITFSTATPIPTPVLIPVTGGGPGPREIMAMAGIIAAALGLLGGAWWLLLRWGRNVR